MVRCVVSLICTLLHPLAIVMLTTICSYLSCLSAVPQIKHVVLQMAGYVSPELREWVETNTTFPNTMVDRITPMTESEHIELVAR